MDAKGATTAYSSIINKHGANMLQSLILVPRGKEKAVYSYDAASHRRSPQRKNYLSGFGTLLCCIITSIFALSKHYGIDAFIINNNNNYSNKKRIVFDHHHSSATTKFGVETSATTTVAPSTTFYNSLLFSSNASYKRPSLEYPPIQIRSTTTNINVLDDGDDDDTIGSLQQAEVSTTIMTTRQARQAISQMARLMKRQYHKNSLDMAESSFEVSTATSSSSSSKARNNYTFSNDKNILATSDSDDPATAANNILFYSQQHHFLENVNGSTSTDKTIPPKELSLSLSEEVTIVSNQTSVDSVVPTEEELQQARDLQRKLKREDAAHLSQSFVTRDFAPAWYGKNPHFQTIVGVLARDETKYVSSKTSPWSFLVSDNNDGVPSTNFLKSFQWDERQRMETPDGDFFDIDWKFTEKVDTCSRRPQPPTSVTLNETSPLVFIVHGLQSSSDSPLVKDMATAFNNVGMDAACINFRGCSGEVNRNPFGYHLSFTTDLQQTVEYFSSLYPNKPIYLSGFSLGANVVTKFLADHGETITERYHIYGAAVNALPFNVTSIQRNLNEPGISKTLYGDRLLQSMADRIKASVGTCEYPFAMEELEKCETILDMENLVVCSLYEQFEDAYDYYNQSSTISILDRVAVPQLIVQALDDPFFENNNNPPNDPKSPLRIQYTQCGGHCGYILHEQSNDKEQMEGQPQSSWMPTELARYLKHIHNDRSSSTSRSAESGMDTTVETETMNEESVIGKSQMDQENKRGVLSDMGNKEMLVNAGLTSQTKSSANDHPANEARTVRQRQRSIEISNSFETGEFIPAWYATNPHAQTILGVLAREETMYASSSLSSLSLLSSKLAGGNNGNDSRIESFQWDERTRMETPDGDFFDVDWKYSDSENTVGRPSDDVPLVLICHGLQASSDSPLVKDMVFAYNAIGMDTACINFRGCSGEMNRIPCGYHAHFTDDLQQMVQYVASTYPTKAIYLSGFSLGANVVTKFLADIGDKAMEEYHIYGAAVNSVPFDMTKIYQNLNEPGFSQTLYGTRLLQSMKDRVKDSYEKVNYPFPLENVQEWKTIMDVENDLICSSFGFDDAFDYYKKSSTADILHQVAVPQLIVQALDDPFFQGNNNPQIEDGTLPLRIHYTKHGGHCGYVFHAGSSTTAGGEDKDDDDHIAAPASWMPMELARFLDHVHKRSFPIGSSSNKETVPASTGTIMTTIAPSAAATTTTTTVTKEESWKTPEITAQKHRKDTRHAGWGMVKSFLETRR